MIIFKNSDFFKTKLSFEDIDILTDKYNEKYFIQEDLIITITISKEDNKDYHTYINQDNFIINNKDNDLNNSIEKSIKSYINKKTCTHSFVRELDYKKDKFENGRLECVKCGFKKIETNLRIKNGKNIAKQGLSKEDHSCLFYWGENTFVQCGAKGLVLGKESYKTAFFEAFPKINNVTTFIRGEGKTISEAEKACWSKYQKYLECKNHKFNRTINNNKRTDGYAICTKCNLKGEFLEPETLCVHCKKPTKNKFNKNFECFSFTINRDIEERYKEYINEYLEYKRISNLTFDDINEKEERFNYFIESAIEFFCFKNMEYNDFIKNKENTNQIAFYFESLIINEFLNKGVFEDDINYPDFNSDLVQKNLKYLFSNKEKVLGFVCEKNKLNDTDIIDFNFLKEYKEQNVKHN